MKKILTTKPHLVVFFLGMIYWPLIYFMWMSIGTWDLNRSIGWGWDSTKFVFWFSEYSFFINSWVLFFPIIYWVLRLKKYEFNFVLMVFQVLAISLFIIVTFNCNFYFSYSLLASIWLLFFANIIAAIYSKRM